MDRHPRQSCGWRLRVHRKPRHGVGTGPCTHQRDGHSSHQEPPHTGCRFDGRAWAGCDCHLGRSTDPELHAAQCQLVWAGCSARPIHVHGFERDQDGVGIVCHWQGHIRLTLAAFQLQVSKSAPCSTACATFPSCSISTFGMHCRNEARLLQRQRRWVVCAPNVPAAAS
jgi:hypothetical protein